MANQTVAQTDAQATQEWGGAPAEVPAVMGRRLMVILISVLLGQLAFAYAVALLISYLSPWCRPLRGA